nr:immunoglobulin heavy chain junction region [Mus musculus]
LCTITTYGLL